MNTLYKYILSVSALFLILCPSSAADYKEVTQKGVTYRLYSNYASVYTETTATDLEIPEQVYYQAKYYPVTELELLWARASSNMNLKLPNSITSFKKVLGNISSMPIPKSLNSIEITCFDTLCYEYSSYIDYHLNCNAFVVDTENPNYCDIDGILFSKDKKTLVRMPYNRNKEGFTYDIPSHVEIVAPCAFYYFKNLSQISFPGVFKGIGEKAFYFCSELQSLQLPSGLQYIGKSAFDECRQMCELHIPGSIKHIEDRAFGNCFGIKELTIPEGIETIGNYAFYIYADNAPSKPSYASPSYTSEISGLIDYEYDFGIKVLNLPESLKSIGTGAFKCWWTNYYGTKSTERNRLQVLTIPKNVKSIGEDAFACGYSSYVSGAGTYNHYIQYMDTIKAKIQAPFKISPTALGLSLSSYYMEGNKPVLIVPIGTRDQYSTTDGWKEFDEIEEENVDINFNSNGIHYVSNFANRTAKITGCDNTVSGDLKLPATIYNGTDLTVTEIADGVFKDHPQITSIQLPAKLENVGKAVFANCSGITSFYIDDSNQTFTTEAGILYDKRKTRLLAYPGAAEGAFMIPETVTSIEASAFEGTAALSSITLRNTVSAIGKRAFVNCPSLRSIYSYITTPPISEELFDANARYQVTLHVVPAALSAYQTAEVWKDFDQIVPMDALVSLQDNGLHINANLETLSATIASADKQLEGDVVLPESVCYMGIRVPVRDIDASVFSPSGLLSVSLPSGITSLDKNVFAGCTALAAVQWNANTNMPNAVLSEVDNPNLLLYVEDATFAPGNIKNVVVNDVAESITLSDAEHANFYVPKAFTAKSISYSHHYSQTSGDGVCQGWETLVLPFDVATISHDTQGEIQPFANWKGGGRPFWLRELTSNGFVDAVSIRANKPYILCFPNNSRYDSGYILSGNITFSATNCQLGKTASLTAATYKNYHLIPNYLLLPQSESIYALNVNNSLNHYQGDYREGSTFIRNLRVVRPFEAYLTAEGSAASKRVIPIFEDDDKTGISCLPVQHRFSKDEWYSLDGRKLQGRPTSKGLYIRNGKRVIAL